MHYSFINSIIMRKIVLSFIFAAVIFSCGNAQQLSIIGGLNMSNMTEKDNDENYSKEEEYKIRFGGHGGLLYTHNFTDQLGIETGVMFNTKGFRVNFEEEFIFENGPQKSTEEMIKYKVHANLNYIDIPVMLKFNHDLNEKVSLIGYTGPALGIAVGGKFKTKAEFMGETEEDTEDVNFGNDPEEDDFKRIDLGLMMGAGVMISNFRVGLMYNQGLLNISPYTENGFVSRNRVLSIGIGYNIDMRR
jgi:hypothetical protein